MIFSLLLAAMLCLQGVAFAQSKTVYILSTNDAPVNMRTAPSKDSELLRTLETGTKVTSLGENGNWTQIRVDGEEGYVMTIFVTETNPKAAAATKGKTAYIKSSNSMPVNLRPAASRSGKVVAELVTGTKVTVLGTQGDWTQVRVDATGVTGYVMTTFVAEKDPYASDLAASTSGRTVYIQSENGGPVNLRATANDKGDVVERVPSGTHATELVPGSVWTKVNVDGNTGYVKTDFVSATKDGTGKNDKKAETPKTMYVKSTDSWPVNLREGRGRNTRILSQLVTGTEVSVLSSDANWSKVTVNGVTGYIMNTYLVAESQVKASDGKTSTAYVTAPNQGTVRMRYGAGTGYHVVTTLDYGTQVTVLASVQGWARVRCGSYEGYINETFLTSKKPN